MATVKAEYLCRVSAQPYFPFDETKEFQTSETSVSGAFHLRFEWYNKVTLRNRKKFRLNADGYHMILFLTSLIGGSYKKDGVRIPSRLCEENKVLDNLQKRWKSNSNVLIVAGAPADTAVNDSIREIFSKAFAMSDSRLSLKLRRMS